MINRALLSAAVAVGFAAVGGGCCSMNPYGGYGLACGPFGCGIDAGSLEGACCDVGPCDRCGVSSSCDGCAGGQQACGTCGLGDYGGVASPGCLYYASRAIRNMLTCGSGCGQLYIDEWYSDPPDAQDPCIDCTRATCPPPGCGPRVSVRPSLWARRFHGGDCSSGDCSSCAASYAGSYTGPVVHEHAASCSGGCGSLLSRFSGRASSPRLASGTEIRQPPRRPAAFPTRARRSIRQVSQYEAEAQ
jgi:hypothetical protein